MVVLRVFLEEGRFPPDPASSKRGLLCCSNDHELGVVQDRSLPMNTETDVNLNMNISVCTCCKVHTSYNAMKMCVDTGVRSMAFAVCSEVLSLAIGTNLQ